jgi:hypothetical protein
MEFNWVSLAVFILGVVARVFVPWLIARSKDPANGQWSWKYLWPQLIAVLVLILVAPIVAPNIEEVGQLSMVPAYILGWGTADLGKTLFLDVPGLIRR